MQLLLIHWISCRMFPTLQERRWWRLNYCQQNPGKLLNWAEDCHKKQEWHLVRENKAVAAKAKKKQREKRMWLKRMAVAAVRRRVRLEGGDEEAEEVQVEGVVAREGQGPWREG